MKKLILGLFVVSALFCGTAYAATKSLDSAQFEQPALITAVGQSADSQMVNVLFKRNNIPFTLSNMAKPEDLGSAKTLVLVVGGSSKGLGAAGIDAAQEEKRVKSLVNAAKAKGIKILAMHVGGESRRGELTDRYIPVSTANADYAIVVEDGDKDKAFAKAMDGKFFDYAKNISGVAPLIKKAFK